MVSFKSCCSLIFLPSETEKIIKQSFCFPIQTYCQTFEHTVPFSALRFPLTSYFCRLKFKGVLVYASRKSSAFLKIL